MRFTILMTVFLLSFSMLGATSYERAKKKHIPISMGMNLNEPQSQINTVTHAQIMADLAKSFRPFDESIYQRVKKTLETDGVAAVKFESEDPAVNSTFVDEYMDREYDDFYIIARNPADDKKEQAAFSLDDYQSLDGFKIRSLVNHFAQTRYRKFSEYGVTVNQDRTVHLTQGSYVYTTGLESTVPGDVPDGIYPLFYKGDVEVAVEGFAEFVECPEKYEAANQCLDIKIPETPSRDGIKLTFTANSDTHLRDFHLILPTVNHEAVLNGEIVFNPDYLEYIKPFSTFRVMNMLLASPRSPFECVTTYVKARDVYSLPRRELEDTLLAEMVNIKLLDIIKNTPPESINRESLDIETLVTTFEELKNDDNEVIYSEDEIEQIEAIISRYLAEDDYLNIMTLDYRIQESKAVLPTLREKLDVLRKKSLEFNWNNVNPNEDYGNCLMKYSRTPQNRAKLGDQFWGTSYITPEEKWRGLPYEVIVALINRMQADVWVNIPHNASVDYVTDMAGYFKENLNNDSKVYIELSNEVWNGGFASQKYFTGLANYRYEYYVTGFLNQFEHYLKTSQDKVLTYRNLRKGYLKHFKRYRKVILDELEQFKSCKASADFDQFIDALRYTEKGTSLVKLRELLTKDDKTGQDDSNQRLKKLKLTETGFSIDKIARLLFESANAECATLEENAYDGDDELLRAIRYKKGNFFEKVALEEPYLNAYWLGYTGAAKGKLKIQVEDEDGNYKDVLVDRFNYTKENKNELHSPDLVYHYSGDEVRELQQELFGEFKKGWNKRVSDRRGFDFEMNAKIYVLKNLHRAYKVMAQMAYVHRLDHIARIWLDSGMDKNRLIFTLATKQNNPNLTRQILSYAVKSGSIKRVDAIATPAYFYGCFGDLKAQDKIIKPYQFGPCKGISRGVLNAKTADEIIEIIKDPENPNGIESIRKQLREHKEAMADADKRLQLVAYEGGHHLALTNMGRNQTKYIDRHPEIKEQKLSLFQEAIEHEGMGDLTRQVYEVWLAEGGTLFANFYMPQTFHEWGSLGLSTSLGDTDTPRYRAAVEYAPIFEKAESARKNRQTRSK